MTTFENWNYLYNWDGSNWHRANLVYTPYVSKDKKTLCMSFNRDKNYHPAEEVWSEELLAERFLREMKFHAIANKNGIPTLNLIDTDEMQRHIFLEWYGDDFYMQGINNNGYDNVLPNWQEQMLDRTKEMWDSNILKFSMHPNSWVVHDNTLIPFNWFFSYEPTEEKITIRSLLVQISIERQDKLNLILDQFGLDLDTPYELKLLQLVCFNSFRSNYSKEFIDKIIEKQICHFINT